MTSGEGYVKALEREVEAWRAFEAVRVDNDIQRHIKKIPLTSNQSRAQTDTYDAVLAAIAATDAARRSEEGPTDYDKYHGVMASLAAWLESGKLRAASGELAVYLARYLDKPIADMYALLEKTPAAAQWDARGMVG